MLRPDQIQAGYDNRGKPLPDYIIPEEFRLRSALPDGTFQVTDSRLAYTYNESTGRLEINGGLTGAAQDEGFQNPINLP